VTSGLSDSASATAVGAAAASASDTGAGGGPGTAVPGRPGERGRSGGTGRPGGAGGGGRRWTPSAAPFLVPNLVLCTVFLFYPLVMAFVISQRHQETLGDPYDVGLGNYLDLARDPVFWEAMRNTAVFTVATVPVGMALGLGVAVLLNGVLPGRTLYRSIIFLPLVISGVATGVLGSWIFDQYNGFVNKALAAVGVQGPAWQSDGTWAMLSIVLMTIWIRLGFDMIIYLAGLQGIEPHLYEAAAIDGAGPWATFRRITVPLLGPSTFFLLVMNLLYSFQVFDTVYAMTGGGPGNSTTMLVTYAYKTGFDERGPGQLGYAAAIGVVLYLLTLAITAVQWRTSRTRDETS
jgi:ABC-type sugar transport system permease subunit